MNWDRKISFLIMILIVIGVLTVVYTAIYPPKPGNFTELYILGPDGKAGNYPTNLTQGQNGNITIGVENHEHQTTNYTLKIIQNGSVKDEKNITLKDSEKLQLPYNFTVKSIGTEKIEFILYKLPDIQTVYRAVYLQINVTSSG